MLVARASSRLARPLLLSIHASWWLWIFLVLFSSVSTYLISQSQLHWVCQTGLQREWSEARDHVVSDLLGGWVLGAGTLFFLTSSLEVCI